MKNTLTFIAFIIAIVISGQYTHSFNGYSKEDVVEVQFSFIPLSISNDQEVNQFELGWRRGAHGASFRYGIDNNRTNYFDVSSNVYFWITKHIDFTLGAGFGTRTNVNFDIKDSTDKFYIPYNFGVIHPVGRSFASSRFRSFPVGPFGISARKWMRFGHL